TTLFRHMTTPADVAASYFRHLTNRDLEAMVALFAHDAVLVSGAVPPYTTEGRAIRRTDELRAYFSEIFRHPSPLAPAPGPFVVDGDRVAVEIEISRGEEPSVHTADFFAIRDGQIQQLGIYAGY